jgi:RND family efflux transporter MFP subunit
MTAPELKKDLLTELRIDPEQRDGGGYRRRWWVTVAVVAAVVAVAAGGSVMLNPRAVDVETAVAQPLRAGGDTVVLDATGYVTARREATVSSKITGRLADVLIEEGEQVKEGQVLARLDGADEQAQVQLAQAQLTAAKAQVGSLAAQLQQAKRDQDRQEALNRKHLTTTQAVDDARTQVKTLTAQLQAQREQIGVAEAQLRIAQINYDNTIIRAPFSGVITDKAAQPGEIVSPISAGGGFTRTGIGTIVDMDSLEVEVDVNEAYINRVTPHQPVVAVLDAYPDWRIPGEVITIIPTADRSKATVKVRIALKQKDPRIVPDMGVRVSFYEDKDTNAGQVAKGVLVPASAVVERAGHSVVFLVDGDRARRHPVTPGQNYGDMRLVQAGLQAGDTVVRSPPAALEDGARIKPGKAGA